MSEEKVAETISRLRNQGSDDALVEVKSGARGVGKDVWRTVSAFANSPLGGQIIFGLDESSAFDLVEGFEPIQITDAIVTGLSGEEHAAKVQPKPRYQIQTLPFETGRVVQVKVEPLTPLDSDIAGPCYVVSQGPVSGAYKRVADQNQKLSASEIFNIHSRWGAREFDSEPVDGMGLDDLDQDLVFGLFQQVRKSGSRALLHTESDLERLTRLNVVNGSSDVTLAGGLTLGTYPQQFFSRLVIDVTVHPQETKDVVGQLRFLDRKICDGPIPYMIQDAITRVIANLKVLRVVKDSQGTDESEIPEDVLREAITNAVMHRDYSTFSRGERVSVDIYPDRVEIVSPGGLVGDRTIENIGEGKSITRNPTLATLLRSTPIPEQRGVLAEAQGSGIPRMNAGMTQQGLPRPKFDIETAAVKVTLHRHGLLDAKTRLWLDGLPGSVNRHLRENLTLALLRRRERATVQELRELLGYDSDDVRKILGNLMADELVVGRGDGPFGVTSEFQDSNPIKPSGLGLNHVEQEVYDLVSETEQKTIRELAEELERAVSSLRPVLRRLVEMDLVIPTAPPQSRRRAYLKRAEF